MKWIVIPIIILLSISIVYAFNLNDVTDFFNSLIHQNIQLSSYWIPPNSDTSIAGRYEFFVDTETCLSDVYDHITDQDYNDWTSSQVRNAILNNEGIIVSGSEAGIRKCLGDDIWNTYLDPNLQTTTIQTTTIYDGGGGIVTDDYTIYIVMFVIFIIVVIIIYFWLKQLKVFR